MSTDVKIPDKWGAEPLRLAEQDSEQSEQAEIQRLSELAETIPGRLT